MRKIAIFLRNNQMEIAALLFFAGILALGGWFCGHRQLGGFDHSALVDTAWRMFLGQKPYEDFYLTTPISFYVGAGWAFHIWGADLVCACLGQYRLYRSCVWSAPFSFATVDPLAMGAFARLGMPSTGVPGNLLLVVQQHGYGCLLAIFYILAGIGAGGEFQNGADCLLFFLASLAYSKT